MTKSQLEQLIDRYLQGNATEQEVGMVEQFYSHLIEQKGVRKGWNTQDKIQVEKRMYRNIHERIHKSQSNRILYVLSASAAVFLLLISGYLYLSQSSSVLVVDSVLISERAISADSDQKSLLLSDGTYVLLSPGATIRYPEVFDEKVRKVELSGEAWFDVQRDTLRPFQVITNEVITTVLGTSFSINANPDNTDVEVRVTSGRVQVNPLELESVILEKDDQLVYRSGEVEVSRKEIDSRKVKLPEPGAFKLANVTMEEAAIFLEKRWHQNIVFENPDIRMCPIYASFNADDALEEVLMILCGVSNSKHRIENDTIRIYGKGCR